MTTWPLNRKSDNSGDADAQKDTELKFKREEGETHRYSMSYSKTGDEWDGLHYFEDPDNHKRHRSIATRIYDAS